MFAYSKYKIRIPKIHAPSVKIGRSKWSLRSWKASESSGYVPYPEKSRPDHYYIPQAQTTRPRIASLMRPAHNASTVGLSGSYRNPLRSKYG